MLKHIEHGPVLGEDIGFKARKAGFGRQIDQVPQNQAGDAATSIVACSEESQLGALRLFARLGRETSSANQDLRVVPLSRNHESRHVMNVDIG